jgi:hypothetical protein
MTVAAQTYADIFEDDARGAAILEDLVRRFARPAVVQGGIDAVLQTYQRSGERHVVDFIVRKIEQARGRETNASETEEN